MTEYVCGAPDEIFAEYKADIPEEYIKIIDEQGGLGCGGSGEAGPRCDGWVSCFWLLLEDEELEDEE